MTRGWSAKVKLTRAEIAEILDALADQRDPFGKRAGDLEVRLSDLMHRGDREQAVRAHLEQRGTR